VRCRQARDICRSLALGPDGKDGLAGDTPWLVGEIPNRVSNKMLDYVAEFDLGWFKLVEVSSWWVGGHPPTRFQGFRLRLLLFCQ
jgi:hypothetical protein